MSRGTARAAEYDSRAKNPGDVVDIRGACCAVMAKILALTTKDVRLLLRDRAGFFVTFVFPLVYAAFFGAIIGNRAGVGTMRVGVVTLSSSPVAGNLLSRLQAADELKTAVLSREEAESRLRAGRVAAVVVIEPGFGATARPPAAGITLLVPSNRPVDTAVLHGLLARCAYQTLTTKADPEGHDTSPLIDVQTLTGHVVVMTPSNQYAVAFPQGIIWGVLGCTAAFSLSIVTERTRGTLVRLRAAPISRAAILGGKAGACVVTTVTLSIALYAVAIAVFGVRPQSYVALGMTILSVSIGFVGIMMFLSVLGRTEQAASGITWSVLLAMSMVGGGMVPHFFMPIWLQELGAYSPVRWAILAMEEAVWRGGDLRASLRPCGYLVLCGIVCLTLGARAFRWSAKST